MTIDDLLDYTQDDCVIDIFDCDLGATIKTGLSIDEAREWHEHHNYDLWSFEPIQRKEDDSENVVFGIVFNVGKVEEE